MSRLTTTIATIGLAITASACAPQVIDTYCVNAWEISYSAANDSATTRTEIKEHNAVFRARCLK